MRSIRHSCSQSCCPDSSESIHQKRHHRHCEKKLFIVGTGPGKSDQLSERALLVLKEAQCVVGYSTYIDLILPIIKEKEIIRTGMTQEVDRVSSAIDLALSGKPCVIVSSGDPGIYAMAGLVFEMCMKRNIRLGERSGKDPIPEGETNLHIEVVPGIPALSSCGSLLGAPLTHDFAVISLSDLLTPWEVIEKRIEASAMADFVIVIYNPKSKKRSGHLSCAQRIISRYRTSETPVGIVTGAFRENQSVRLTTLKDLPHEEVTMQSTLFIGNSRTFCHDGFMITPRGYSDKYDLHSGSRSERERP